MLLAYYRFKGEDVPSNISIVVRDTNTLEVKNEEVLAAVDLDDSKPAVH